MTDQAMPISDLMLERFHLGELRDAEASRITARLAHDRDLRARLDSLSQSDRAFIEGGLAGQLERAVLARVGSSVSVPSRPWVRSWQGVALASASVVLIAALVASPGIRDWVRGRDGRAIGGERVKGDAASLLLYRKNDEGSELLADGTRVRRGDLIRVAYRSVNLCFGVIVSIDGRGTVTRHLPHAGDAAAPIQPGEATPLDSAYELDDAPKGERFFLVTGDREFGVETVMEAARRAAATPGDEPPGTLLLPAGLRQSSFLLRKAF